MANQLVKGRFAVAIAIEDVWATLHFGPFVGRKVVVLISVIPSQEPLGITDDLRRRSGPFIRIRHSWDRQGGWRSEQHR
jgi:hypothetical protein